MGREKSTPLILFMHGSGVSWRRVHGAAQTIMDLHGRGALKPRERQRGRDIENPAVTVGKFFPIVVVERYKRPPHTVFIPPRREESIPSLRSQSEITGVDFNQSLTLESAKTRDRRSISFFPMCPPSFGKIASECRGCNGHLAKKTPKYFDSLFFSIYTSQPPKIQQ